MAIEKGGEQTKLIEESRPEQLARFFQMEVKIQLVRDEKDKFNSKVNELKNKIKGLEKEKVELLNDINKGQITFSGTPEADNEEENEPDNDAPSDADLDAMDQPSIPEEKEEVPAEPSNDTAAEDDEEREFKAFEWILSADGNEVGRIKCKHEPEIGDIRKLPSAVRGKDGKVAFVIRNAEKDETNHAWNVSIERLNSRQKADMLKAKEAGVPF